MDLRARKPEVGGVCDGDNDLHDSRKSGWLAPPAWGGPAAWVVTAAVLMAVGSPARQALAFLRADIARGQVWRLSTCNFVHLGFWHLFLDGLGLLLWVFLCGTRVGWLGWCTRTVVLALGVGVGLYVFVPHVVGYVGLSGMIYGLLILDLGHDAVVNADGFAALCVAAIMARVAWAIAVGTPTWEQHLMGGEVIGAAHVCGMAAAVVYVGVALAVQWYHHCRTGANFRILGRVR